jgi:1D-myo-inositol-triphosphate 3-kinase
MGNKCSRISSKGKLRRRCKKDLSSGSTTSHGAENGVDVAAQAREALLRNRQNAWVQLAGHPGSFVPASLHTIWKKQTSREQSEAKIYRALMYDSVCDVIPKFYSEFEHSSEVFIEIEDLLFKFTNPNIMDIKMGTRTFLESEVQNAGLRDDLYKKMVKIDPSEPTAEENDLKAITKLRYMQFREKLSTSASLGFRIDAVRLAGQPANSEMKQINTQEEVASTILKFLGGRLNLCQSLLQQLVEIRTRFEASQFFKNHEIIGSSLLVIYDNLRLGVWMIDFAKTLYVQGATLTHREPWRPGSHEDGYLVGMDNLIEIVSSLMSSASEGCNGHASIDSGFITGSSDQITTSSTTVTTTPL